MHLKNHDKNSPPITKTIVVVGATGSGKSSSLNVIATKGYKMIFREAPLESIQPTTTVVQKYTLPDTVNGQHIDLVDTPGINDQNDLSLQKELLLELQKIDTIALVIFCCPFNIKNTPEFEDTINYYTQAFKPLMERGRFGLLLTHLNSDTYQNIYAESHVGGEKISEILEKKTNHISRMFNVNFGFAWLMGKIYPFQVESYNEEYSKYASNLNQLSNRPNKNQLLEPHSIGCRSLDTRSKILKFVVGCDSISLKDYLFPLPPLLHKARITSLNIVNSRKESIEKSIRITTLQLLDYEMKRRESEISELEQKEMINQLDQKESNLNRNNHLPIQIIPIIFFILQKYLVNTSRIFRSHHTKLSSPISNAMLK